MQYLKGAASQTRYDICNLLHVSALHSYMDHYSTLPITSKVVNSRIKVLVVHFRGRGDADVLLFGCELDAKLSRLKDLQIKKYNSVRSTLL